MKKSLIIIISFLCWLDAFGQPQQGLKVFISVDMEGITGVVNADDVRRSGKDYPYFRKSSYN